MAGDPVVRGLLRTEQSCSSRVARSRSRATSRVSVLIPGSSRSGAASVIRATQPLPSFAADGPKPEIVLGDAVNNDIRIVRNAENCLVYDRPLNPEGLTWADLLSSQISSGIEIGHLGGEGLAVAPPNRLWRSLASKPEQVLFRAYAQAYLLREDTIRCPALIPQVYLHHDPQTRRQRGGKDSVLGRERMDFLLLLPHSTRVVLEVDGQQHYADGMEAGAAASPHLYSKMAAEDRALRLKGYERAVRELMSAISQCDRVDL